MSLKDEEPPATSFANPRKTGWLYKHGGSGVSSHWRKRWFIVDSNYLFYYKTPSDKKPVGILCLQDYASCSKAKDCKKPYSFVLDRGDAQVIADHDNGKNYLLYTDSEKDMMEWIKAMTEEMKGPMRQHSDKTRQLVEKVDQKALEEISKTASEGPKLVHLTADRPKIKNRRPPLKKYTTFHEADSKEDVSEDDSPAASRKKPDSLQQQSSVRQKQPLPPSTKSMDDEELIKEPPGSPGHVHKQPLLPKGGSKIIKPPEDVVEVAKVKPLPLPPKKEQSQLFETKKIPPTEREPFSEQGELVVNAQIEPKVKPLPPQPPSKKIDPGEFEVNTQAEPKVKPLPPQPPSKKIVPGEFEVNTQAEPKVKPLPPQPPSKKIDPGEFEVNTQAEPKVKPLPPQPPSKKIDPVVSADSQICAENKLPTTMPGVNMNAEADLTIKVKPLPSPKKKDTLVLIDNKADQPHTVADRSNAPVGAGDILSCEASHNDENKLKDEECISEERTRKSSSTSEELPICRSDDSYTPSVASSKGKPDEAESEAGSKPKPKPRKRAGKEQQATVDQCAGKDQQATVDQCAGKDQHATVDQCAGKDQHATVDQCAGKNQHATVDQCAGKDQLATVDQCTGNDQLATVDQCAGKDQHATVDQCAGKDQHATVDQCAGKDQHATVDQCAGKDQQATHQYEALSSSLHEGSMATETTEAPLTDTDQNKATPIICNKLSEVAVVPEDNRVSNGSKETADHVSSDQLAEVNLPRPVDSLTTPTVESIIEGSVPNSAVSLNQESVISSTVQNKVCSEFSSADKCETVIPIQNERKGEVISLPQEPVASNLDLVLQELLKATSPDPVITDKDKNTERVYDAVVRSDSNEISPNPLERDALGYTVIRKDAVGAVLPSVSDTAEHLSSTVPKSSPAAAPTDEERAPRVREPYRAYETVDILPHKPQSPSIVSETAQLALKQAKEVLRLAQSMRAETEEMRKEVQRELELAKRERYDAGIMKKNAAEILKMAKEKLQSIQQ